jgi:ABC-type nitrate/sulfonate/bicarbonate transport system substrate-binding protein
MSGVDSQKAENQVETTAVSQLWYTRCPVPTATSIAISRGDLDREFAVDDIKIDSLRASADRGVRESHFDHTQLNSFRQGGNIPPIWSRSKGADTVVIGLTWVDEYQAIISLPSSGIRTVKDLRGRRLGLPVRRNDQIDFFNAMCLRGYVNALRVEAMTLLDVDLIELSVEERYIGDDEKSHSGSLWAGGNRARRQQVDIFALIRGEVDAIYTSGAQGANVAAFLGAHEIIEMGFHPDSELRAGNEGPATLTVSGVLSRERPDLVARYIKTLNSSAEWANSHHDEAAQIVAADVSVPFEWVEPGYQNSFARKLTVDLTDKYIEALLNQKKFLLKYGFIDNDFDVEPWIDSCPLELASKNN